MTNRIVNIILTDLSLENLKVQEELERIINSKKDINNKVEMIKKGLEMIALNELKIAKLQSMVTPQINNEEKN